MAKFKSARAKHVLSAREIEANTVWFRNTAKRRTKLPPNVEEVLESFSSAQARELLGNAHWRSRFIRDRKIPTSALPLFLAKLRKRAEGNK